MQINRSADETLDISSSAFEILFAVLRADPGALYMVCRDYDGYHESGTGSSAGVTSDHLPTYFMGSSLYALLWTFDPLTARTTGIFLNRRRDTFFDFADVLEAYVPYVHTPHVLCLAIALHHLHEWDGTTGSMDMVEIRELEEKTDVDVWSSKEVVKDKAEELLRWAQKTSQVAGRLANKTRNLRNSKDGLLVALKEAHRRGGIAAGVPAGASCVKYETSLQALNEVLPGVERHFEGAIGYCVYLQERAERLGDVVSSVVSPG